MNDPLGLLFDTQAVVSWAQGTTPAKVISLVEKQAVVHVSVISLWEFMLKSSRFQVIGMTFKDLQAVLVSLRAQMLPIEVDHLMILERLPVLADHGDPFDRLIISQAISEHFVLVGKDRSFPKYGKTEIGKSFRVLWE